jgi:hypothetical protein
MARWRAFTCSREQEELLRGSRITYARINSSEIQVSEDVAFQVDELLSGAVRSNGMSTGNDIAFPPITGRRDHRDAVEAPKKPAPAPGPRFIIPSLENAEAMFSWLNKFAGLKAEVIIPHAETPPKNVRVDVDQNVDERFRIYVIAFPDIEAGSVVKKGTRERFTVLGRSFAMESGEDDCLELSNPKAFTDRGWKLMTDDNGIPLAIWKDRNLFFLWDIAHRKDLSGVDLEDKVNLSKYIVLLWLSDVKDPEPLKKWVDEVKSRFSKDFVVGPILLDALKERHQTEIKKVGEALKDLKGKIDLSARTLRTQYDERHTLEITLEIHKALAGKVDQMFKDQIEALRGHPKIDRIRFFAADGRDSVMRLEIVTKPIAWKDWWLGQYQFTIPLTEGAHQVIVTNLYPPPSGRPHPHIKTPDNVCWGNSGSTVQELLSGLRFFELTDLLVCIVQSVTPSDGWGSSVREWQDSAVQSRYIKIFGKVPKSKTEDAR